MTPEEIDQLAACRMHVAELHTALKAARDDIATALAGGGQETKARLREIDAALARSEPEMLDIISKARALVRVEPADLQNLEVPLSHAIEDLGAALSVAGVYPQPGEPS
ncbi:MAG TPA: hypothetical protein VLH12_08380 [Usitatibacter sp.]|nr:hypothetical protein [Usitatibacter sp.]